MMLLQLVTRHTCLYRWTVTADWHICRHFSVFNGLVNTRTPLCVKSTEQKPYRVEATPHFIVIQKLSSTAKKWYMRKDDFKVSDKKINKKDGVSEDYSLVYEYDQSGMLRVAILFPMAILMLITSVLFVSMYVFRVELPEKLPGTSIKTMYVGIGLAIYMVILFLIPAANTYKKAIIRLYRKDSTDDFIAIVRKNVFQEEQISFKFPDAKGYFGRGNKGNFVIKGRSFIAYENDFSKFGNQKLFNQWFGYYK